MMTLVKLLRNCASSERICADCPGNTEADCANELMLKAADEIEWNERRLAPKKPKGDYHSVPHYRCPECNSAVKLYENSPKIKFCIFCGQAIDWSDIDE